MAKIKDELLDGTKNIFLTGKAGTGKTYKLKEYMSKMESEGKTVLVCAPTGTAASNIDGETAHSLFGIPVPCYGVSITKVPKAKINVLSEADAIIIDEISMMRNDAFAFAMKVLKKAEKQKGSKIRVILSGDFSQLPPVVQKNEIKHLKKCGFDESGYAFTTKEWKSLKLKTIELTVIHRQEDGSEFAEMLGLARECSVNCIPYFLDFVDEGYVDRENDYSAVRLCGTNAEADKINSEYLDSLPGNVVAYQSVKSGRGTLGITDDIVLLKEGATVMFTVNDNVKGKYTNGSLGKVKSLFKDKAIVTLENGDEVWVGYHEYKTYSYKFTKGVLSKNQIGSIKQIPLKVAAAITIHKSQGKTFDKAVITPDIFAPGQLYVALSRVKSEEGLILTKEITINCLKPNTIVDEFYKNGFEYEIKTKTAVKKTTAKTTKSKTTSTKSTSKTSRTTKKSATNATNVTSATKGSKKKTTGTKTATKRKVTKKTPAKGKTPKTTTKSTKTTPTKSKACKTKVTPKKSNVKNKANKSTKNTKSTKATK